jgi:hypothetical protein
MPDSYSQGRPGVRLVDGDPSLPTGFDHAHRAHLDHWRR